MASPQAFSPHASRTLTGIMQQQQFTNQSLYLKSSDSDWRPGFSEGKLEYETKISLLSSTYFFINSKLNCLNLIINSLFPFPVGRHGARGSSPTFIGRPPTISLSQVRYRVTFVFGLNHEISV